MAGRLIVFEGTDGSGKSTQFALARQALEREGREFRTFTYPQYQEESSALVRMYLGGQFGTHPSDVNAYAASTFLRWTATPATSASGALTTNRAG